MAMDPVDALAAAYGQCASVLDRVTVADHGRGTPCEAWDLGALAGHVVGSAAAFAIVLDGGPTPAPARVAVTDATSDQLRSHADRVHVGWRSGRFEDSTFHEVIELDGGVLIPPIPLPSTMLLDINLLDVGVHAHDRAAAVDLPALVDDADVARAVLVAARSILQPGIRELAGFGPERSPRGPGPVEELLAFVGR